MHSPAPYHPLALYGRMYPRRRSRKKIDTAIASSVQQSHLIQLPGIPLSIFCTIGYCTVKLAFTVFCKPVLAVPAMVTV
jgi:hypothetical protein